MKRILKQPRFTPGVFEAGEQSIHFADNLSFMYSFVEIFRKQLYRFACSRETPLIIDAGANIGLSILYFIQTYPQAHIIAFEADPYIFEFLTTNLSRHRTRVELHNLALWSTKGDMLFKTTQSDAGHLVETDMQTNECIAVQAVPLSCFLNHTCDLLKMDIEGAEYAVLSACHNQLHRIRKLFVEYHSRCNQPQRLAEILQMLQHNGFRYQIHTQFVSHQPLFKQTEQNGMDMQLNLFAYHEQ